MSSGSLPRIRSFSAIRLAAGQKPRDPDWTLRYLRDSLHVTFLFAMPCPVLCAPKLRSYVARLGADAIVNLLDCEPAGHQP